MLVMRLPLLACKARERGTMETLLDYGQPRGDRLFLTIWVKSAATGLLNQEHCISGLVPAYASWGCHFDVAVIS